MRVTITAATGNLGRYITEEAIRVFGVEQLRLVVRNPQKASEYIKRNIEVVKGDYLNKEELVNAFEDTDVLIYIPSITHPSIIRIPESENVIGAAEISDVKHFLFVSFFADQEDNTFHMSPFFGFTNRRLACSGLDYTIVKNAMYTDPLLPYLPELQDIGKLIYPVPHGKISFISREDSAKAVIKIASDEYFYGGKYILTQSRNYTMTELAELLTKVGGRKIQFEPISVKEFGEMYDEPKGFGVILASLYDAAERGMLGEVSEDFRNIMGYEAESIEEYFKRKSNNTK